MKPEADAALAELDRAIAAASPQEHGLLLAELASRTGALCVRVAAGAGALVQVGSAPTAQLITPEAAAAIADVPVSRIYAWAKGQRWATRPTRRCLRIEDAGFRRWLASKGAR